MNSRGPGWDPVEDGSSLRSRSIKGLLWTAFRMGGMVTLRLTTLVVLARLVAPAEFGVMSAALIVIGFSSLLYTMGVGPALVQRPELTLAHVRSGVTGSVVLSVLLGAAVALAAPLVSGFFAFDDLEPVLQVIALEFPLQGIAVVARAMMQRELRFRTLAAVDISSYALSYGAVGITLGFLGAGVWALVAAHLLNSAFAAVSLLIIRRGEMRPGFDRRAFSELMVYGGGFTLAKVLSYSAGQADNVVVGRWLGAQALGVYGRAYQLVVFPVQQLNLVINLVLFPAMSRIQESGERLAAAFRRGITFVSLIFGPVSIAAAILGPEIISVALGSDWEDAIGPFQVLALGMALRAGNQMSDTLVQATGAVYRRAWRQGVFLVAVVLGSWIGQNRGVGGVAVGVLIALFINFALMAHLGVDLTAMTWSSFARAHLPAFWLSLVTAAVVGSFSLLARGSGVPDLVTLVSAVLLAAGAIALLLRYRPSILGQDRAWIWGVLREARNRRTVQPGSGHSEAPTDPEEGTTH